jgi:hypothetical protein
VIPSILIATTRTWPSTARLGIAFAKSGCNVESVAPARSPLRQTRSVRHAYEYEPFAPLESFLRAIQQARPDLVLPGDDLAYQYLCEIYLREEKHKQADPAICELIRRSIGPPESFPITNARASFMEVAEQVGIRVPRTAAVSNIADLEARLLDCGFPAVLKADGSSSGEGVKIIHTLAEAKRAFRALQAPPPLARAAKRALVDRDMTLIGPVITRRHSVVNLQSFIAGLDVTSLVACWEGQVVAGLYFEVVRKQYEHGPSSVLRINEHSEIVNATKKITRRLMLSGLHGFDFLLEKDTQKPFLIEMNPRTTQVGHLALGPGRDLPAAMTAAVSGRMMHEPPKVTENHTIALFPQEWHRNPESTFLNSAYHDIPWEEPNLIRGCLREKRKWNDRRSLEEWMRVFSTNRPASV